MTASGTVMGSPTRSDDAYLPVYLLLDVSASTVDVLQDMTDAVNGLSGTIAANPLLSRRVLLTVIVFSDQARIHAARVVPGDAVPPLRGGGGTRYGPAFHLLADTVRCDLAAAVSEGRLMYRPLAFFVTDGVPVDQESWGEELRALQMMREAPTLFAVGMGDVDPAILNRIASRRGLALVSPESSGLPKALASLAVILSNTLTSSVTSSVAGKPWGEMALPKDSGFGVLSPSESILEEMVDARLEALRHAGKFIVERDRAVRVKGKGLVSPDFVLCGAFGDRYPVEVTGMLSRSRAIDKIESYLDAMGAKRGMVVTNPDRASDARASVSGRVIWLTVDSSDEQWVQALVSLGVWSE